MSIIITTQNLQPYQWGALVGASLVAGLFDWRTRRIPNAITAPLLVAGLVWATWMGGLPGLADAVMACVLLALPYLVVFVFSDGGAGDAKLMGAIGAWLGLKQGIVVLFCVAVAGIVLAVATAIAQRRLRDVLSSILVAVYGLIMMIRTGHRGYSCMPDTAGQKPADKAARLKVPYGVAIFAGVCTGGAVVLLW